MFSGMSFTQCTKSELLMAPVPGPDVATSEHVVHEPRDTECDESANVHMGTPSIVIYL